MDTAADQGPKVVDEVFGSFSKYEPVSPLMEADEATCNGTSGVEVPMPTFPLLSIRENYREESDQTHLV